MSEPHAILRLESGDVAIRLGPDEHALLRSLAQQLRAIVAGAGPREVGARLFPAAYGDRDQEAEYRQMMGDSLVAERLAAVDAFTATLNNGESDGHRWAVELSPDQAAAWLSAVNDARLTLGVMLGVESEEDWQAGPDPDTPASVALFYLGWLQDDLVRELSAGFAEAPD
ncbi:MAG TPA: DUF2017 family protein [Egibacteraceae bacterium]|nr:DUF2017 family protein [Egibacteraceae bacterium]